MEVKVLFPPNKEIAELMIVNCAAGMKSTRTQEPAHALNVNYYVCSRSSFKACEQCGEKKDCAKRMILQAKEEKHWGVFEHFFATVSVSGISRVLTHQLVRHRLASYLQQSSRHVKPIGGILPQCIWDLENTNKELYLEVIDNISESNVLYDKLIHVGIPKEDARFIMHEGSQTHIMITMNARQWLHFFYMRLSEHAQWEIKEVAQKILDEFMKLSPIIFEGAGELEV